MTPISNGADAPSDAKVWGYLAKETKAAWRRYCPPPATTPPAGETPTAVVLADGIWFTLCAAAMLRFFNPKSVAAAQALDIQERQHSQTVGVLMEMAGRLGCETEVRARVDALVDGEAQREAQRRTVARSFAGQEGHA